MSLLRFIARRLILTIPMLLGITLVMFIMYNIVQPDPLVMLVGERALDKEEVVQAAIRKWGLDRPKWEQYLSYLGNYMRGDLGVSFLTRRPVLDDLRTFMPATIELAVSSLLFAVVLGIPLGILAGLKYGGKLDRSMWTISLLNASLPPFWTGLLFLYVFYYLAGVAPGPGRLDPRLTAPDTITGLLTVDSLLAGNWTAFVSALHHLVLPTLILGGFTLALVWRVTRAAIVEEIRREYIRTARSKGMRERRVVVGHALRNVLLPLITILGLAFAGLMSGAVMTESVFEWAGIGQYLVHAAASLDYPAIQGGTLVIALIYMGVNLMVDILYSLLDPRVRFA